MSSHSKCKCYSVAKEQVCTQSWGKPVAWILPTNVGKSYHHKKYCLHRDKQVLKAQINESSEQKDSNPTLIQAPLGKGTVEPILLDILKPRMKRALEIAMLGHNIALLLLSVSSLREKSNFFRFSE